MTIPRAEQKPQNRSHHGDTITDPYEWLRDKENPEVIAHLEQENAYTEERLGHLAGLRAKIFNEISARTQHTDLSVPTRYGAWWYYTRTQEGQQYGIHCRAPLRNEDDWTPPTIAPDQVVAGEQVIFDGNVEASEKDFFSLGTFDASRDGELLLYGVDTTGDERYTLRLRDLSTGEDRTDVIEGTFAGACLSPDCRFVIYTTVDKAWRPDTVWLHEIGTNTATDTRLFHESDERFWVGANFTRSDRYLVISSCSSVTSEHYLCDATDLHSTPRMVWEREDGVEYELTHAVVDGRDMLYILHNRGAIDFELVRVDAHDPQKNSEVVVAHQPGRRLLGCSAFSRWGLLSYRRDGLSRVAILNYHDNTVTEIRFDQELFCAGVSGNPEWDPPLLRIGYGSFIDPATVYDYEISTGALIRRKQQIVLGNYDSAEYGQERIWVTATDGTRIPLSLVYKKSFGHPGDSPRPVHFYGYGSYEHSIEPGFSVARLSLLDRGVIFAVAHVRGGGEMGRGWYEDGKKLAKRNTFTDFVDCARYLASTGITTPDRLVAEGGSAGGLLVGAAANLAPELFAGVLADVPFVDALTTILDPSLPLSVIEWDEWGNPLDDAEVYAYMKSYSPYENIRAGVSYPKVLAVTSLNDTRVLYVEPAKWVARLRDAGVDALLKCEMVAGHGGVTGRYNAWEQRAYELAWILDVLGARETTPHT